MRIHPGSPQNCTASFSKELIREALPWLDDICKHVSRLAQPEMNGRFAYVVSDYGGDHSASDYSVISILWANFESLGTWEHQRRAVREQFLRNGRRMAFKNLNDRQRRRALSPFFLAANQIDGICLTIAIRKSIKYLCSMEGVFENLRDDLGLQGRWKPDEFERLCRVVFVVVALISVLGKPSQEICWISDEDSLFANRERQADVSQMLRVFSRLLVNHVPGQLWFGTTQIDPGDRREEDLAAIPDLTAGAVAELVTLVSSACGGVIPFVCVEVPRPLSWKSGKIIDWFFDSRHRLKRFAYVVDQELRFGPFQVG